MYSLCIVKDVIVVMSNVVVYCKKLCELAFTAVVIYTHFTKVNKQSGKASKQAQRELLNFSNSGTCSGLLLKPVT